MHNKNIQTFKYGWLLLLPLLFLGCKKFVDIDPPKTQLEGAKVFSNDQGAISAVSGMYAVFGTNTLSLGNGGTTLECGLSSDELYAAIANLDADPFSSNTLLPSTNVLAQRLFTPAYAQYIYRPDAILEGLAASTTITDSARNQLRGEVLVVRAMAYFYLVNLFGDIPLVTNTDYESNGILPRAPAAQIYSQIIADLDTARSLLKNAYPSMNRARPNRFTATALLARVYLYLGDWVKAEALSTEIIQSGLYPLVASGLNNVFLAGSTETIWQLVKDAGNTAEGSSFIPASTTAIPTYVLRTGLLNAFEPNDKRKTNWIGKNTVNSVDYYYPMKYRVRVTTPVTEYLIEFRSAEQYLIRAEARANQDNISGAQADLNMIRNRAGLANTTANDKAGLLAAIEQERRVELFSEMGHRWLDLKRWKRADAVLGPLKAPNWQSTDTLYPIPQAELDKNPFLIQNPGY